MTPSHHSLVLALHLRGRGGQKAPGGEFWVRLVKAAWSRGADVPGIQPEKFYDHCVFSHQQGFLLVTPSYWCQKIQVSYVPRDLMCQRDPQLEAQPLEKPEYQMRRKSRN